MTRSDSYQTQIDPQAESELVTRLAAQASRVTVSPELLDGVAQRHRSILRRQRALSRVALASSLVGVVALAFVVSQLGGLGSDSDRADTASVADPVAETATVPPDVPADGLAVVPCLFASAVELMSDELIIWLDVGVGPEVADRLNAKLSASSAVVAFDYVDQRRTFEEFKRYYAEQPEIIALVEPEQLPTSYRLKLVEQTQAIPSELAWVATVDGVDQVELGDGTCEEPGLPSLTVQLTD